MNRVLISLMLGLLMVVPVYSEGLVSEGPARLIAVLGKSQVELEPNRALLSLEVRQSRKTLEEARAGVGSSLKVLVGTLNQNGITDKNIEKTQIWQGPDHQWENNQQVLKGYHASVQLTVTLDDLSRLATLVDALASQKDTTLQNTAFTRSDMETLQSEQRKLALLNAKQKATEMLAVYQEKLGPVLTIREEGVSAPPVVYDTRQMKAMAVGMAEAVTEPGTWQKVTVGANVQVEFLIP